MSRSESNIAVSNATFGWSPAGTKPSQAPVCPVAEVLDNNRLAEQPGRSWALAGTSTTCPEIAYIWDFYTDQITWESQAAPVLGLPDTDAITRGEFYRSLIAPEHLARQASATRRCMIEDTGHGVPYRISYRLLVGANRNLRNLWVEDYGRWWAGPTGQPARARGVLRIHGATRPDVPSADADEYDHLTGQLSRARLTDAMTAMLERAATTGQSFAFLMIGIDGLDRIVSHCDAEVGDRIVLRISRAIRKNLRSSDILGRYSPCKFGVILNDCDAAAMTTAASRLHDAVRHTIKSTAAAEFTHQVSIGGVALPEAADSVNGAFMCALRALEAARDQCSSDCVVFNAVEENARDARLRESVSRVRKALSDDRLELHLQPIVAAKTREIMCYEALIRIRTGDGRVISAGEFVADAETVGLSGALDRRALQLALNALNRDPNLRLSMNISARTCSDPAWMEILKSALAAMPSLNQRLLIEITETTTFDDIATGTGFVDTLKQLGCRVAIDDFGTGYASFATVKHLAVDVLKIDGSFIRNILNDPADQAFTRSMVALADALGLETVAEWVSDDETARFVEELGVSALQGFYFGRPMLAQDVLSARIGDGPLSEAVSQPDKIAANG